jgi:hypothetical protein
MPVMQYLESWDEDHEFKASLSYIVRPFSKK